MAWPALIAALFALPLMAQPAAGFRVPGWPSWLMLAGVGAALWLIFYFGLYPLLLRHYRPDYCKFLFWSLFLLYGLAWLHLSCYLIFGFAFGGPIRWAAAFLSVLWLIFFAVVLFRHRSA